MPESGSVLRPVTIPQTALPELAVLSRRPAPQSVPFRTGRNSIRIPWNGKMKSIPRSFTSSSHRSMKRRGGSACCKTGLMWTTTTGNPASV